MFNIATYLEKFKKMEAPGDTVKCAAEKAIFESVGIKIEKNEMNVVDGVLFLTVPSIVKNEVYMSKRSILEKMREILKEKAIKDIR
ncbi:MAG: DciA family protein [Candidatus Parcubacteria bacterium]|nr:DciA family protein [Candidatus Parcubacteria bacterium]